MPITTTGSAPVRRPKAAPAALPDYETYLAPPPPKDGRLIGVDCHPDTFTAAVFTGQSVHDARKLEVRHQLSLEAFLAWAVRAFGPKDLFLLEAGSNSFEVAYRLRALDRQAAVLESAFVGKHTSTYKDNDKLAAARIALVYLGNKVPCVWVPDEVTRQRRELLNAYTAAVSDHTAAGNQLKGYLNEQGIRLGKRNPHQPATRAWVEGRRTWSPLQKQLLEEAFGELLESHARRDRLRRLVAAEVSQEPLMLRTLKLLGIGTINAFAILAVVGDVRRFAKPQKLAAYLGLNPGEKLSGKSKEIKIGIGRRGRGDLRHLLVQAAHAILRSGKATALGQWGWKLFARKGHRNIAVGAVARKLAMQIWHVLKGHPPKMLEADQSLTVKLRKLAVVLGSKRWAELGLGNSLRAATDQLRRRLAEVPEPPTEPPPEAVPEPA
jgi:transposase